jgi:hypothetical protein
MKYCPKCDNIMDISRTAPKLQLEPNHTTLSSTDKSINIDVEHTTKIINMYLNDIDISTELVDIQQLQKNPEFTKLKDKDKKNLLKILKASEEDVSSAYMICNNCSYFEKMTKRTMVLNKMGQNSSSEQSNIDYSKYKYIKYIDVLPHTRDYVCKNKDCQTHKNYKLKDAKWFRPVQDSYQTYYICCVCDTIWNNS